MQAAARVEAERQKAQQRLLSSCIVGSGSIIAEPPQHPAMTDLKAVFWDVDGTLADTEMEGHRPAFNTAFAELGLNWCWDQTLYQRLLATPGGGQRMLQYALERGEPLDSERLANLKRAKQHHYLERIRSGAVTLRPGVARLLAELQQAGIAQWIVTSSGQASVEALLTGVFRGTDHPFQGVVSSDDVNRHKPHPDPYWCALRRSGIPPEAGLAIEDSAAGLVAATDATLACLVTPSPWERELPPVLHRACAVIDHLGEPTLPLTPKAGPPCAEGLVTLEYLQSLLECVV